MATQVYVLMEHVHILRDLFGKGLQPGMDYSEMVHMVSKSLKDSSKKTTTHMHSIRKLAMWVYLLLPQFGQQCHQKLGIPLKFWMGKSQIQHGSTTNSSLILMSKISSQDKLSHTVSQKDWMIFVKKLVSKPLYWDFNFPLQNFWAKAFEICPKSSSGPQTNTENLCYVTIAGTTGQLCPI